MRRSRGEEVEAVPQQRNRDAPADFEVSFGERLLCKSCSANDQRSTSDPSIHELLVWPTEAPAGFGRNPPRTRWGSRVDEAEHWQSDMADATAHLATAWELIDGLLDLRISSLPILTCIDLHEAAGFAVRAVQALDTASLRSWAGTASQPERSRHAG
jgi:hypothetical protein